MNKGEAGYARHLSLLKAAGEIGGYAFEPIKLRLADRTWYEVDFLVEAGDGVMEVHEFKGFWEEDARIKWKVAAEQHPWLRFFAITEKGGSYVVEPAFIEDRDHAERYGTLR